MRPIKPARMLSVADARLAPEEDQPDTTAEAVARLVARDPAAWQDLFDTYFKKMHKFAYARTGDTHAAEEIASEVFVAAVRGIGRYKTTGAPIGAWLYKIARNLTADHLDRARKRPTTQLDEQLPTPSLTSNVESQADLAQGIAKLTREQQEVITLRFVSDCSVEDTARSMGKSIGAVKLLQHRALASLRRQLGPEYRT